ncbi:hypothetical protein KKF05_03235 [Patescibacteria group bacterium]|nr:hypothetical protein [Patescibacteria group bacterium]MBU1028869.1 hypothetical protein [Patescibacteria group bacterium]MBU1915638.1 hypothetical protein [Patescibacteria group bacterium]
MIDLEKLVALLTKAEMPAGELEAWKKIIPLLSLEQIEELMDILLSEQVQLAGLREEYLAKARQIVESN